MGDYACQFGTIHRRCRCPVNHIVACPTPKTCQPAEAYVGRHKKDGGEPGRLSPTQIQRLLEAVPPPGLPRTADLRL